MDESAARSGEEIMPPADLSAEEAAALDFLRKDADALAEGGSDLQRREVFQVKIEKGGSMFGPPFTLESLLLN
jgi:hypothetical protein